ncbi:MAG: tyrosine-protein phosphatase [Oscillospiraceae bacterium]|nr:tyrosine-protein phosphatase [Oscillospiraceae bacterium]
MREKLAPKSGHRTANPLSHHKRLFCLLLTLIAISAMFLAACGSKDATPTPDTEVVNPVVTVDDGVALPQFDTEVLLCSQEAKQVFDRQISVADAVMSGDPYRPFVFGYQLENASGTLLLSLDSSLSNAREFYLDKEKTSVSIDNLQTDATYYYQVTVADKVYSGSFRTALSNRFISVPGVENMRDIGGYQTLDGKTVKQGLLIRGCELDGLQNEDYVVSAQDLATMQSIFGFVYDLDLRSPEIAPDDYESVFGSQVAHKFYDAPAYAQIFRTDYLESMRAIFADLANPDNYPMYLHCTWGRDRTGTIVLLLHGLLNVSQDDALQEYRLTGYVTPSVAKNDKMDALFLLLDPYEGDTFQEKVINYLTTTVGVTPEEIASIQSIFLA